MKTIKIIISGLLMCSCLSVFAQDATGKWNASIETPQGAVPLVFDLAAEGAVLTGNISNQMMPATAIQDGVIDGNNLTWKLVMEIPNAGAMTIHYNAVLSGDELNITSVLEPAPPGGDAKTVFTAIRAPAQ